jgi:hypothetical protein
MNEETGLDFFLSHNKAEKEWTSNLADALSASGASVFLDERSIAPGEDIVKAIGKALELSRCLVFVMSPRSVVSPWVELEWASTLYSDPDGSTRRVLPVLLDDCEIPFIIRRLKYIDARNLAPAGCAEVLLQGLTADSGQKDGSSALCLNTSTPLRLGSKQYVLRPADQKVEECMRKHGSCYVFGPRMTGKTSLLLRVASTMSLAGVRSVFVDLSYPGKLEEILRRIIVRGLGKLRWTSRTPTFSDLIQVLEEVVRETGRQVLFVIDEMDSVRRLEEPHRLLDSLRMLSDVGLIRILCAGLMPPWDLPEDPAVSPLSASLEPVSIGRFDKAATERLCELVLTQRSTVAGEDLVRLTGGHAGLTIAAIESLYAGNSVEDLLSPQAFMCYGLSRSIASSVEYLVDKGVLAELLRQRPVRQRRDRERLWLAGATLDPETNPPEIAGEIVRVRLEELLEDPWRECV